MNEETKATVLQRISELQAKAIERLEHLERSGALAGDEDAGLIMADITAELADGYSYIAKGRAFRNLRRF